MTRHTPLTPSLDKGLSAAITDIAPDAIDLSSHHGRRFLVTVSAALHVRVGNSSTTAATTDLLMQTSHMLEVAIGEDFDHVCAIAPSGGSGTIYAAATTVQGTPA